MFYYSIGEMAEWLKAHAWKACIRQKRIQGSNPCLSAIIFSNLSCFKNFSKPLNPRPAHYKNLVISISYYINFPFPDFNRGKINFFEQPT